jgi:hypothetical protein
VRSAANRVLQCYASEFRYQSRETTLTDPEGRIWIDYFDEAGYWSRNPDGTRSSRFLVGLARWDNSAATPWLAPVHTGNRVVRCDCYALDVGRTLVYACPS